MLVVYLPAEKTLWSADITIVNPNPGQLGVVKSTVDTVNKVQEGRPHIVDHIKNGDVALVINTVKTAAAQADSLSIRREALHKGVPYYTTMRGALAAVMGIEAVIKKGLTIRPLQEYHGVR